MRKYDYLVLDIFSGKYLHLASDNRYKNGTIVKGFEIKELLKINY
jgi:hypothetical protein